MRVNLVFDGNFLFHRLAFVLNRSNQLQYLGSAMAETVRKWSDLVPRGSTFFASDSKKHWRRRLHADYKSTRKRDSDLDWELAFDQYEKGRAAIREAGTRMLEAEYVEGDDWVMHAVRQLNAAGESCVIMSADSDMHQLLEVRHVPLAANVMLKETYGNECLYVPEGWEYYLDKLEREASLDLFSETRAMAVYAFMKGLSDKYRVQRVSATESLFKKLVMGDRGDNIPSVHTKVGSGGKSSGIGEAGANKVYEEYQSRWPGDIDFTKPEFYNRAAEAVAAVRGIEGSDTGPVIDSLRMNVRLVMLDYENYPKDVLAAVTAEKIERVRA